MGNQFIWEDRYNIGVDFIDREHKKLFKILNKLFSYKQQEEASQWLYQEGIKYFKDHAMTHFIEEEAYMASIRYVEFETHRRLHDNFRKVTLPTLEKELTRENYSEDSVNHFLGVCAGWLIGHTLIEDHAITGKSMSKWVNILPEQEQTFMKQVICELLYEMFRLKAQVISESYGGEKFGKGIYYRLIYGNQKEEKWEFILALEEKLVINTVGSVVGKQSDTINVMLMHIVRYIAQQFVERIKEHYPSADLYEKKKENLLTYEQFQKIFEQQHPQFSLLFDTKAGYFAYSVFAPQLLENERESIKEENAISEIEKYLEENKPSQKKKILIVDDSAVVRKSMQKLLESDYEVTEASSGMAAIRSITLNKPDLILLDFEMPVCDGMQVLEMIRTEKDFTNIPVIFLTGRNDTESVKKVLALKPAGYLIKSLEPEEIRESIHKFFKKQ